jgi:hypothetical protein
MLNLSVRRCWFAAPSLGRFTRERDVVYIAHGAVWVSQNKTETVWRRENL